MFFFFSIYKIVTSVTPLPIVIFRMAQEVLNRVFSRILLSQILYLFICVWLTVAYDTITKSTIETGKKKSMVIYNKAISLLFKITQLHYRESSISAISWNSPFHIIVSPISRLNKSISPKYIRIITNVGIYLLSDDARIFFYTRRPNFLLQITSIEIDVPPGLRQLFNKKLDFFSLFPSAFMAFLGNRK